MNFFFRKSLPIFLLVFFLCTRFVWSNSSLEYENFKRNIQDLRARMDAFNQKLADKTKIRPFTRTVPFSTRVQKNKESEKSFDELFPSPGAPVNIVEPSIPLGAKTTPTLPLKPAENITEEYSVMPLVISYGGDSRGLPPLNELKKIRFPHSRKGGLIDLGGLMNPSTGMNPFLLSTEELREISQICIHYLKESGLEGMVAMVNPSQIDPSTGADLRGPGETGLEIKIWVARVKKVHMAYSASDDNKSEQRIMNILANQLGKQRVLGQPLRSKFKKTIKRMGRNPGKSARLLLLPSDKPGLVEGVVEIKAQKRTQTSLGVANNGSPTTGEWLWNGQFRLHELSRSDDPLDLSFTLSETGERFGVGIGYRVPLVQPGILDLSIRGNYGEYDGSSFALTPIHFEGSSMSTDLALHGNPLSWESEKGSLGYQIGFNYERVKARNSIFQENAEGTFLTPRISLFRERKGRIIRSLASVTLKSNLGSIPVHQREFMGGFQVDEKVPVLSIVHQSMINLSKLFNRSGDPYANLDRHSLWLKFKLAGALTNNRMLPQRQWLLGGTVGVRGYPEAIVAGDRGFLFSMEYRWKLFSLGSSPKKRFSLSVAPFFDYGQSFVKDPFFYESDQTLIGLGCGLLSELPGGGRARLDFAKPLKKVETGTGIREGTKSDDYRIHASTQWTF
ncbi:MAG: ShlB/FhaC/HecB family hemolysin secretion/activation protein [Opitutae bacterium]|nr:ShlB/FhaC/HecB family hemolysin secretion/activation protein [Opitutae bacterium]